MSFHQKPKFQRWAIAVFVWPIEGLCLFLLIGILKLTPRRLASACMGRFLRLAGPYTRWHKRSLAHLSFALPHLSAAQKSVIIQDMWENLGRNIGEYFHLNNLVNSPDLTISGLEHLDSKKGGFLISGHFGNWEIIPQLPHIAGRAGGLIYRSMNNPIASHVFKARLLSKQFSVFEKGREGAVGMLKTIKTGGLMVLLSDQTLREGVAAPLFGRDVKTATSHFKLAAKTGLPIYFARTRRIKGAQHSVEISPPIYIKKTATNAEIIKHATDMNKLFECWIKEEPSQWMWPHRRWGKSLLK